MRRSRRASETYSRVAAAGRADDGDPHPGPPPLAGEGESGRAKLRAAVLTAALIAAGPALVAHGQEAPWVIPAGQEELAGELLGAGEALPHGCAFDGAALERVHIEARYLCDGEEVRIILRHRDEAEADALTGGTFSLSPGEPPPPPALLRSIAERAADPGLGWRWARPGGMPGQDTSVDTEPITTLMLLGALVAMIFLARRIRLRHLKALWTHHRGALLVLPLFLAVSMLIPEHGPVHEHATFIQRSDCALAPGCDAARVGWAPPAYHVYGIILRALPYRLATLTLLSLALTSLALVLFYALVHGLVARFEGRHIARRVAFVALALAAFHPLTLRLSVATSFWPWALTALFGSGALATLAARGSGADRVVASLAAGALFGLAITTSVSFFTLAPLVLIFPACLCRRAEPAAAVAAAVALAFAAPHILCSIGDGTASEAMGLLPRMREGLVGAIYFDWTLTPLPAVALFVIGLASMARRPLVWGAVLYALAVSVVVLGAVNLGFSGYPSRYLHGFSSLFLSALVASLGLEVVRRVVVRHRPRLWRVALPIIGVSMLVGLGLTHESRHFLLSSRPLAAEARAISAALEHLPEHELLVIPPVFVEAIGDLGWEGDPIEAHYPRAEHGAVLHRRFGRAPTIVGLDEFDPDARGGEVLVYVGSALVSWQDHEIRAGAAPPDLARPELRRLRERWTLEPVHTFEIDTSDHWAVHTRLGGRRLPQVELGFFRLVRSEPVEREADARAPEGAAL